MNRAQTIEVLVEVARRAMNQTDATHPVDLAQAASIAVESAGDVIDVIRKIDTAKAVVA